MRSDSYTAVKFFDRIDRFDRELEVYQVLRYELHLRELFEHRYSDALHVAEMFRRATGFILLDIHPGNIAFDG